MVSDNVSKFQIAIWTDFYNIRIKTTKFSQKKKSTAIICKAMKLHSFDNMNGESRYQRERKSFMECT